ncbi:MAG TPA: methyltransferase domain-containing protein [Solirubrobacteraceae bacterium]
MLFDETASRRLLATYLTPDIVRQRRQVLTLLDPRPGERILDLGSGPGLLAEEIAVAVGAGGGVEGVDISDSMLAIARERTPPPGAGPIGYTAADALALPFGSGTFDAIVSTQVYEYVADIPSALIEARRVLRPSGRLVILDTDWDSIVWHSRDPQRMERVLSTWDQHLADPQLPRILPRLLRRAGFTEMTVEVLPILNVGFDPDTLSAGALETIARFVRGRGDISETEADAWAEDLRTLGEDYFFSLNRYVFVAGQNPLAARPNR